MDRNLVLLNRNIARLRRDVRLQLSEMEQLIAADLDCTSAAQRLMPWEFCKMHPAQTLQVERAVNEYAQWQAVPAEDRSDAPAWWWDTALAAVDETATMPVEWCVTLGVADGSTYAKGAEVFKNALVGQTYLPQSDNFPRKFKAIDAAAIVPKSP